MNLHFLSNCKIFVKQQVDLNVKVTSFDAPRHSAYNLVKVRQIFDHNSKISG